jgi:hypothetical protein
MTIERTAEEIIIRISSSINVDDIQQLIDYLTYKQIVSKSPATQKEADALVANVKKGRWAQRRNAFIK